MELLTRDVTYELTFYDECHNVLSVMTFETYGRAQIVLREIQLKFETYRIIKITTTVEKEIL